jgi:A/G-specific adenine glycosylase
MLQQTQTQRVVEKYTQFIAHFSSFEALAKAPTAKVIGAWVGLGYNRRALALQGIAQKVVTECGDILSDNPDVLITYKGLGPATAASIVTFAFNKPTVFIETNVRTVFLHAFFNGQQDVHDKQLLPFIAATVDQNNPREWYYALMDCGVLLKKLYKNPSRQSKHHTQQSKFQGSDRQLRGAIVRLLTQNNAATMTDFENLCDDRERMQKIVQGLCKDGLFVVKGSMYTLG